MSKFLSAFLRIVMLLPLSVVGQSLNSVKTTVYKQPTVATLQNPASEEAVQNITYYDGLGRAIQQIAGRQASTGNDIILPMEYDSAGRVSKEYLPYPASQQNMAFDENAIVNARTYYTDKYGSTGQYAFSERVFEPSPLQRLHKQSAPGEEWKIDAHNNRAMKYVYGVNTALAGERVRYFKAHGNWNGTYGYYEQQFVARGTSYYPENTLYMTVVKDENWKEGRRNTTERFQNAQGKVIMERKFDGTSALETYYVYDQFDNLAFVIPPGVGLTTGTVLNAQCYQYRYDHRNRLVEKKVPGKGWEFILYDNLDRIVGSGPAFKPFGDLNISEEGWNIIKYDVFDRVVLTGWLPEPSPINSVIRHSVQANLNVPQHTLNETKLIEDGPAMNGIVTRYSNLAWPSSGYHILTVNYFDDYDFPGAPSDFGNVEGQVVFYNDANPPKGLPTGNWVRVLEHSASQDNELSYYLYDDKGQAIRTRKTNHLGGYSQVDVKLDFVGKPLYAITTHKRTDASDLLTIKDSYEYTEQGRIHKHLHQINQSVTELLSKTEYDAIGNVSFRRIGGSDISGGESLQKVDYSYNIRGWLTDINNVDDLGEPPLVSGQHENPQDFYAFQINYTSPENTADDVTGLYNGNISEFSWRSVNDNVKRSYGYVYDDLSRLTDAFYRRPNDTNPERNSYSEHITYNLIGNILTLDRFGDYDDEVYALQVDELVYSYDSTIKNRLKKVTDLTGNTSGFTDGANTADEYGYDAYGNLIRDDNKGITAISYNHLGLPVTINMGANSITYQYNATGQKIGKSVTEDNVNTQTDYLDGFQYKNNDLQFFGTAEGYVQVGFTRGGRVFQYVYQLKDHLGNNRLTFAKNVGRPGVSILDETNYYPFGMPHKNYNVTKLQFEESNGAIDVVNCMDCKYKYKYNGKEWQNELGLNMTAMDWRLYDNALGRFHAVDKFAELAPSITPYRFGFNNPIYWSDAAGLFESREAAMAHIGEYGLENATVSYNRGRWEVKNGSHSFWDKGDGDIGYSYAISHGLGYGTVTGGGSSGNQGGYGGFLIWGTQRDGDQTGHRGSASASVKWNDFVQPMKPQSLNNRAKPGLWEYIKSLFSNSATTYSQATTIQEKLKEMDNNSTVETDTVTHVVPAQSIEATMIQTPQDTSSWFLQYWKDGAHYGGRHQTGSGYLRAAQQMIQDRNADRTIDSIQIIRPTL